MSDNEILNELRGDMKLVLSKLEDNKDWQTSHEKKDDERNDQLHERISSMKKYALGVTCVAGLIGFLIKAKGLL